MKRRMLAALLALCMVLSLGTGALAAEGEDSTLWFATEDGQTEFTSEAPATVTMTATVPQDGTYVVTTKSVGPADDKENFSISSENEALAFLADEDPGDVKSGHWPVELTAGDYAVTAENVTSLSIQLVYVDTSLLPDNIPQAVERVTAHFRYTREEDGKDIVVFRADQPSSCDLTANVPQDGLYFVEVDVKGSDALSMAVAGDGIPLLNQLQAKDDGSGTYVIWKKTLLDLTAGTYDLHVENATYCSVKMELTHPLDAIDGVIGEGLYVCPLEDDFTTVNYTLIGVGSTVEFYSDAAEATSSAGEIRLRDKNSEQKSISFMSGMAVIDFDGGYVTSALVGGDGAESASPAQSASESGITEEDVLNHYGLTAEEFAALKAAIAAQIQAEWTADEAFDSNLMGLYDWTYTTDFIIRVHSDETSDITEMLGVNIGKNLMTDESMDQCIAELAQYCTGNDPLFQQRAMVLGHAINRWAADNGESYERWCMVWEGVMIALSAYVDGITDGPTDAYIRPLLSPD